jgi:hypothetical protein
MWNEVTCFYCERWKIGIQGLYQAWRLKAHCKYLGLYNVDPVVNTYVFLMNDRKIQKKISGI